MKLGYQQQHVDMLMLDFIMEYTEEQLKSGFWIPDFFKDYFGNTLTEVKEFDRRRNLRIACTQLLIPAKEQNRILKEWLEILPNLQIDFLMISSHVPQKLLDAIGQNKNLKGLYIKWTKAKTIECLTNNTNLEYLHIGSGSSLIDVDKISNLKKLKVLEIENTKKTSDYSFLKSLSQLEMLKIKGGIYSTLKVDTIDTFIGHLQNLILFQMVAVRCPKPDYKEIIKLRKLINLLSPVDFHNREYEKIKSNLPLLRYDQEYYEELRKKNLKRINEAYKK